MGPDPEILRGDRVRLDPRRREPEDREPATPGPGQSGPGITRRQRVVAVVLVAVVAAGWYADRRVGEHESSSIATCAGDLRAASHEYDVRMSAMYDYARPSLSEPSAGLTRLLSSLMAEPARQVLPAAGAAADRCRGVHVLPWHSTNVARRNADRAYASALVLRLRDVAAARHAFRLADPSLSRLRAAAGIPPALAR